LSRIESEAIKRELQVDETIPYTVLARRHGKSRQRVAQIANKMGLSPRNRSLLALTCSRCGVQLQTGDSSRRIRKPHGMCAECWEIDKRERAELKRKKLTCVQCGQEFSMLLCVLKQWEKSGFGEPKYCSKACRYKGIGIQRMAKHKEML